MEGLKTIKGRKHKSFEINQTLGMCLFGGSRAVSPLSISGISEVRANTSSELRAAPGMPRDVACLARTADGTQPKALLAPYPCWPVSPRVGNVKNNHPSLIEPIAGAGWARRIGWPMEAMSWHRWLATLLVMRALAACAKGPGPGSIHAIPAGECARQGR